MQKATKTLLALMAMSSILTGCASTTTSVKKSNSTLFKIGDTTVTKQKVYDVMKINNGATYTADEVKEVIEKAEIKNEDNINSKVEQLYKDYVGYYGTEEDFLKQLTNNGYDTPEEFKKTQLKPQAYENILMEKYTTKHQKKYLKKYQPTIVRVLAVDDKIKAKEAIQALNSGGDWDDVYKEYTSENSGFKNENKVLTTSETEIKTKDVKAIYKSKETGLLNKIYSPLATGTTTRFIIKVVSHDIMSDEYLDNFTAQIKSNDSDFEKEVWKHYLKKHNFKVHDQDIFNSLRVDNPEYLYEFPEFEKQAKENSTTNQ